MCRLGPDGYGSISSWYQWVSSGGAPGSGFGALNALASSQTRCHFASICSGSYRLVIADPYQVPDFRPLLAMRERPVPGPGEPHKTKKPLAREAGGTRRGAAAVSPCPIEGAASSPR